MVQKLFAALYEDRSRDYSLDNEIHYFGYRESLRRLMKPRENRHRLRAFVKMLRRSNNPLTLYFK